MTVEYSALELSNGTLSLRLLSLTLYEVCYGVNVVDRAHGVRPTTATAVIKLI